MRFEGAIKTDEGKLNRAAKAYLEKIQDLELTIFVLTTGDYRKCLAYLVKWGIPYHEVIAVDSLFEIADICREHKFVTYYDTDKDVLYNVRTRGKEQVSAELWDKYEVS